MLFKFEEDENIDLLYIELVRFKLLDTIKEVKDVTFDPNSKLLRITFNVNSWADTHGYYFKNNFGKIRADVFNYIKKSFFKKKMWYITASGRTII